MARFDGKVALVTGAAGGIGRAIAHALARDGAAIGIVDLPGADPGRAAEELRTHGLRAEGVAGDVADAASISAAAARVAERLGPVDILVNNAGVARIGAILDIAAKDWRDSFAVNVDGTFNA